jgi:hypothetical protein
MTDTAVRVIPPGDYPLTPTGAVLLAETQQNLAQARLLLAERDHMLARYCETIDEAREERQSAMQDVLDAQATIATQRERIEELTADRDELRGKLTALFANVPSCAVEALPAASGDPSQYRQTDSDNVRSCTCHLSEALNPCPRQYAYTECLATAAGDAAVLGTGVLQVADGEARRVTLDEFQKPSDAPAFPANALRGGDGIYRGG